MWAEKDGVELKIAKETQKLNWYVSQPISAVHYVLVHVVAHCASLPFLQIARA
jgi:hypothetical protein